MEYLGQLGLLPAIEWTRSSAIAERPRCSLFKLWQNISVKSVHLTLLYVTALTSTNHHFTFLRHHVGT